MTIQERWLNLGYDHTTYKHRELLAEKILSYSPKTILDVGCASGPDIALLHFLNPELKLAGFDKDAGDVEKLARQFPDVQAMNGLIQDILPSMRTKSFDVVFSNGVMMYNDKLLLSEMIRIAKKAVILSERGETFMYTLPLKELGFEPRITKITEDIRDSWKEDGYIFEIVV